MSSGRSTREQRAAKAAALRAKAAKAEARRRQAIVGAIVLAVVTVLVIGFTVVQSARRDADLEAGALATPGNLGPGNSIVVGSPDAKVTITAYEDFLCPGCNRFEQVNAAQIDTWIKDGTAKVEYRPVAILDHVSTDDYSTRAMNAAAAVVTVAPAGFAAFHKALFANQPKEGGPGLSDDRLLQLAATAGAPASPSKRRSRPSPTRIGWPRPPRRRPRTASAPRRGSR